MQEMQVRSLSQEDPWRKEWLPILVFLSGKIPWTEEPGSPWGCKRVGHDLMTKQQIYRIRFLKKLITPE